MVCSLNLVFLLLSFVALLRTLISELKLKNFKVLLVRDTKIEQMMIRHGTRQGSSNGLFKNATLSAAIRNLLR